MIYPEVTGINVDVNQALLLKILTASGSEVRGLYEKWAEQTPFDSLDGGSLRMMPMLYKKLEPLGLRGKRYEKIKGIYRYTLYKNSIIFSGFQKIVRALNKESIPVMLLKGGALILNYYQDKAVRPMNDIDILIEERHVKQALEILADLGWHDSMKRNFDLSLQMYPTVTLNGGSGFELDVHWNIMTEYGGNCFVSELWNEAFRVEYNNIPVYILSAEDQVIHNCAHGVKWNELPSIRWIPDVLTILENKPDLSWNAVVRKCRQRKLTLPVRNCLVYLKMSFGAPIPDDALAFLFAQTVSDEEQKLYSAHTAPPTFYRRILRQWGLYRKTYPDRSWPARILLFPSYLKEKSGIVKYRDCLVYLGSLAYRSMTSARERPKDPNLS